MNNPLLYLGFTSIKNSLKEFIRKPLKIIYALFFIAMLVFVYISGNKGTSSSRDINELTAGIIGIFTLIFILTSYQGFKQGGTFFSMSDVNLLFTSPLKGSKILNYGLIKQIKVVLLTAVFIIFQYGWLHLVYNINFGGMLLICVFYGLTVYLGNLCALLIYSKTSYNDNLRNLVKAVYFAIIGVFILYLLLKTYNNRISILPTLVSTVNQVGPYFPFSGWVAAINIAIIKGNNSYIIYSLITVVFLVISILILKKGDTDFYEDVLCTTEASSNAIASQREGKIQETTKKDIKIGKIGLTRGQGASVFYYKHLLENRRLNAFGLDIMNVILIITSIVFTIFMSQTSPDAILGSLAFTCYMEAFAVSRGRLNKELGKPFIYLAPLPAFTKLYNCLRESFETYFRVTAFITIFTAILFKLKAPEIITFFLGIYSFSFVMLAVNMLIGRLFGTASKTSWMLFYILVTLIYCIPGIGLAILFGVKGWLIINFNTTIMLMLGIGNLIAAFLSFYFNRGMLEKAELNN